jgi:hypothetical protein
MQLWNFILKFHQIRLKLQNPSKFIVVGKRDSQVQPTHIIKLLPGDLILVNPEICWWLVQGNLPLPSFKSVSLVEKFQLGPAPDFSGFSSVFCDAESLDLDHE